MRIDIITLFPDIFFGPLSESIIGRANEQKLVDIRTINLRDFTTDKRKTVDDKPYGGGPGMLLKPEPVFKAIRSVKTEESLVILTTPQGAVFNQATAREFSNKSHLIFVCGHYEGVDERIRTMIDIEVSIGDYVLTSGNLAAMVMVDSIVRLLPGVLGSPDSEIEESFSDGLLEYPQYTRPEVFERMTVPEVLLSGHHGNIEKWRQAQAVLRTKERRPDLLKIKK